MYLDVTGARLLCSKLTEGGSIKIDNLYIYSNLFIDKPFYITFKCTSAKSCYHCDVLNVSQITIPNSENSKRKYPYQMVKSKAETHHLKRTVTRFCRIKL